MKNIEMLMFKPLHVANFYVSYTIGKAPITIRFKYTMK